MEIIKIAKKSSKMIKRTVSKETPTILTALGVSGLITTVILAVKATPKALWIIDKAYYESESNEPLTRKEIIKLTWKCYVPATVIGGVTIACIVGSNHINLRRNAALVGLYTITAESLKDYQEKVIEEIGKNKELKLRDSLSQDKLNKNPVDESQIIITGTGESLFYDSLSGRYFRSDMESIRKKINDFNMALLGELYQTLNEWYDLLNLEPTEMGKDIGWEANDGLLEIHFSAKIATNGVPCIVLEYRKSPKNL